MASGGGTRGSSRTTVPNVAEFVRVVAARDPARPCLLTPRARLTYGDVDARVETVARGFATLGVRPGDHVALDMANDVTSVVAWLGLARIGGVLLPVNPAAPGPELTRLLETGRPRLFVTASTGPRANPATEPAAPVVVTPTELHDAGSRAAQGTAAAFTDVDAPVTLIPTSGTTSAPKLVVQTHRAYVLAAEAFPWWLGLTSEDRLLTTLPLFHLNAQLYSLLGSMAAGASLVLLERFSASRFWAQAREHHATQFNAVEAMVEMLLRQPPRPSDGQHDVRVCYTAPALPRQRHVEFEERFGVRLLVGYGLSESPYGTIWPLDGPRPYGSMGRLRQHPVLEAINEGRVVDENDRDVADGQPGELLLRNPAVMQEYLDQPAETARTLRGGWLHTGDLVQRDEDGNYFHVGRLKEMIRRRGENVAPREVEAVLVDHAAVAEVAVVGVPSDLGEEDIVAFVVPAGAIRPLPDELAHWCGARLAPHKVPSAFTFVDALPTTPTGRVAKYVLRQAHQAGQADPPDRG
jgi:crotonobetaine/carnitine-CoA ligase